jgi:hypothetical protein
MTQPTSESKASQRRVKAAKRRTEALELRLAGYTYAQIGERLGCSLQRAHRIVTQEFERLTKERTDAAQALVSQELERLERLHRAHWDKALAGDMEATDRIIKLMNRRAKLLGLDVPTTLGVNVNKVPPVMLNVVEEVVSNERTAPPATAPCAETLPGIG